MKVVMSLIALSLFFTSCVHIYFLEPQPKGGERLTEFPQELFGTWWGQEGGVRINEVGITDIDFITDSVENVIDTVYETMVLCDTFRIYQAKELFVLNVQKEGANWELLAFKPLKNGDIEYYTFTQPEVFIKDSGLELLEATYIIDGESRQVTTLDPSFEESIEFESAVFSGQMKLKTLRKALKNDDSKCVFKSDGTIYCPGEFEDENE